MTSLPSLCTVVCFERRSLWRWIIRSTTSGVLASLSLFVFSVTGLVSTGQASLIAYEPFNYTTSIPTGTASTASGFAGNWTCGTTPAIVTGMTYTDLPVGIEVV